MAPWQKGLKKKNKRTIEREAETEIERKEAFPKSPIPDSLPKAQLHPQLDSMRYPHSLSLCPAFFLLELIPALYRLFHQDKRDGTNESKVARSKQKLKPTHLSFLIL